jgi:hypothetical protein
MRIIATSILLSTFTFFIFPAFSYAAPLSETLRGSMGKDAGVLLSAYTGAESRLETLGDMLGSRLRADERRGVSVTEAKQALKTFTGRLREAVEKNNQLKASIHAAIDSNNPEAAFVALQPRLADTEAAITNLRQTLITAIRTLATAEASASATHHESDADKNTK